MEGLSSVRKSESTKHAEKQTCSTQLTRLVADSTVLPHFITKSDLPYNATDLYYSLKIIRLKYDRAMNAFNCVRGQEVFYINTVSKIEL